MNASLLAEKMLEWENKKRELDLLEEWIKGQVLELEQTQTVGNVRASYSAGRKSYDYEGAWREEYDHLPASTYQKVTYDYRAACKDAAIEVPVKSQSAPSVSLKLLS